MSISIENKDNIPTFSTDSFTLAVYLLSEACRLIRLDRTNPRRILFIFEETNARKLLTDKFLSYHALCEPHRLYSAQRDLKQLIYQNTDRKEHYGN